VLPSVRQEIQIHIWADFSPHVLEYPELEDSHDACASVLARFSQHFLDGSLAAEHLGNRIVAN